MGEEGSIASLTRGRVNTSTRIGSTSLPSPIMLRTLVLKRSLLYVNNNNNNKNNDNNNNNNNNNNDDNNKNSNNNFQIAELLRRSYSLMKI